MSTSTETAEAVAAALNYQVAACMGEALRVQTAGELKPVSLACPRMLRIRSALTDWIEGQKDSNRVPAEGHSAVLFNSLGIDWPRR